ncbi:hypothetical protein [Actinoplanes palleronii]|uniref:Uncharacterized protein n=1 Tax=Actinoplanes palleronii TaxID=113570 RepID=A0ABQ4BDD7_9ACTN|nr:hypothetical protein [Actinoplanes palleronii]GIE68396.1 hypothetical protein Apa02nite_045040 [Actinoplanes palleronii]
MSTIISFYAASDDAAAALGPGDDALEYGNFDIFASLEEWEGLLLGSDLDAVAGAEDLGDEDGPVVLRLSAELTAALAGADAAALADLAERWLALRAADDEDIDPELAEEMLTEVAALARPGTPVYCEVA